ncbi:MAG: hypothetical protein ACOC12_04655 [Bacteroidota bacterium]
MKSKLVILVIITTLGLSLQAQDQKNAITLEIGGGGFLYSINYEFLSSKKIVARVGFSYTLFLENQTEKSLNLISAPLSVSYLQNIYNNRHFLELGLGAMNLVTSGDMVEYKGVTDIFINPYLVAGYRFWPLDRPWNLKIGLTPFYGTRSLIHPTDQGFSPLGSKVQVWGYAGIGYSF